MFPVFYLFEYVVEIGERHRKLDLLPFTEQNL